MRLEKIEKKSDLFGIQTHPIPLNPHGLRANRTSPKWLGADCRTKLCAEIITSTWQTCLMLRISSHTISGYYVFFTCLHKPHTDHDTNTKIKYQYKCETNLAFAVALLMQQIKSRKPSPHPNSWRRNQHCCQFTLHSMDYI
jgi:hypothetical protein